MQPENGVKSRRLNDAHVAHAENAVYAIVKRLKVANGTSFGFIADLVKGLIDGEQLVKRIS